VKRRRGAAGERPLFRATGGADGGGGTAAGGGPLAAALGGAPAGRGLLFLDQAAKILGAATAIRLHPVALIDIPGRSRAATGRLADVRFGDAVAKANIHAGFFSLAMPPPDGRPGPAEPPNRAAGPGSCRGLTLAPGAPGQSAKAPPPADWPLSTPATGSSRRLLRAALDTFFRSFPPLLIRSANDCQSRNGACPAAGGVMDRGPGIRGHGSVDHGSTSRESGVPDRRPWIRGPRIDEPRIGGPGSETMDPWTTDRRAENRGSRIGDHGSETTD